MQSHARLFKHPLHPMLIVLPSAIFPLLLFLDVVHFFVGGDALWQAGLWLGLAGVVTTLAAMVPGFIDMHHIPDGTRAHRIVVFHMVAGILTLLAYAATTWARWGAGPEDRYLLATGLDVLGTALVGVQGWLGGELVYKHHVAVNAPEEGGEPVRLDGNDPDAMPREPRRERPS